MLYVICLKIRYSILICWHVFSVTGQKMENYQLNWSPKSTFMYFSRVWERDSNWSSTNSIIENELYQLHLKISKDHCRLTDVPWRIFLIFLIASVFRNFLKNESTTKTKFWNHGKEPFDEISRLKVHNIIDTIWQFSTKIWTHVI